MKSKYPKWADQLKTRIKKMYEEIQKGCYREIGAMIARIMFVCAIGIGIIIFTLTTTTLNLRQSRFIRNFGNVLLDLTNPDETMTRALIAGIIPALCFLAGIGAKKYVTGHVIHAEWWNGMQSTEKAFSLLLMAFVIGMAVFSLTYWLMTR